VIRLSTTQLWVHDQEEALAFWTEKVGMEVRSDVTIPEMGNFRWLTVGPAEQPDIAIVLMEIPGPPGMDAATAAQVGDELLTVGSQQVAGGLDDPLLDPAGVDDEDDHEAVGADRHELDVTH